MVSNCSKETLAAGVGVGVVAGVAASRALRSMLYGVGTADPITIAVVAIVLVGGALFAAYTPAQRATHVDPVDALRAD